MRKLTVILRRFYEGDLLQSRMEEIDSLIQTLMEKEIPDGRQALKDGHENLAKVAAYCEQKYRDTNKHHASPGSDKTKAFEETRAALEETKKFATQSLASVAYQINSLALSMLNLMDNQALKVESLEATVHLFGQVGWCSCDFSEFVARALKFLLMFFKAMPSVNYFVRGMNEVQMLCNGYEFYYVVVFEEIISHFRGPAAFATFRKSILFRSTKVIWLRSGEITTLFLKQT